MIPFPELAPRTLAAALTLTLGTGLTTVAVRDRPATAPERGASPAVSAAAVPSAGPDAPQPSPSPGGDALPRDLEERVQAPPAPATRLPDDPQGLGGLDARRLLALSPGTAEARAAAVSGLEGLGFRYAVGHAWTVPGGVYVVILYRFDEPTGAARLVRGLRSHLPGTRFRSHTVTGATAWSSRSPAYFEQHASFAHGRYVYETNLLSRARPAGTQRFDALLGAQAGHARRVDPDT